LIDPAITVLMAVHNGQEYVRDSIGSILVQTCGDFEFIIVDDGSTDSTPEILKELSGVDDRIKVITNDRNTGLAAALNTGLAVARGRFVARQDADDLSEPDRLSIQLARMSCDKEIGLLCKKPFNVSVLSY